MKYFTTIVFAAFIISIAYIFHTNKKAAVKRTAFRWWMAIFATFLLVSTAITIKDLILMVFVVPVVAWVALMSLKFTKFCDWCGKVIHTNLYLSKQRSCPRCGSSIS
jgi:hypothetical protein